MSPAGTGQSSKGAQSLLVLLAALGVVAFLYGITRSAAGDHMGHLPRQPALLVEPGHHRARDRGHDPVDRGALVADREADGAHDGRVSPRLLRVVPDPLLRAPGALFLGRHARTDQGGLAQRAVHVAAHRPRCPAALRGRPRLCARGDRGAPGGWRQPGRHGPAHPAGYHPPDALRGRAVPLGLRPRHVDRSRPGTAASSAATTS